MQGALNDILELINEALSQLGIIIDSKERTLWPSAAIEADALLEDAREILEEQIKEGH